MQVRFDRIWRLRRLAVATVVVGAVGACAPICGIGSHFTLTNAHVDSVFNCPSPASDYAYLVHGTIDADNYTDNAVKVKSVSTITTTVKIAGNWTGPLGRTDQEPNIAFSPKSIDAGSKAVIKFAIPFVCTDTPAANKPETYGDFAVKIVVVTSAGTIRLTSTNNHRLRTP